MRPTVPRARRRAAIAAAVLLVVALVIVRRAVREHRRAVEDPALVLASVFSPSEQMAAAMLGGFRSVLLNVLWVRIQDRLVAVPRAGRGGRGAVPASIGVRRSG